MTIADQLTGARSCAAPFIVLLDVVNFEGHDYWATALFVVDLGKLKTWSQAVAAGLGGLAVAGAFDESVAWWALVVALVLTWVSGLDYARLAPGLLRSTPTGQGGSRPLPGRPAVRQRLR